MGKFTAKQVQALMLTFLTTRAGYGGEDLQRSCSPHQSMCKEPDISKVDQVSTFILLREDPRPKATAFTFGLASPMCMLQSSVLLEALYDPSQSLKKGKATDQLIIDYRGVQLKAVHIKLGTKETLALGDAVRDWNPDLEIDRQMC